MERDFGLPGLEVEDTGDAPPSPAAFKAGGRIAGPVSQAAGPARQREASPEDRFTGGSLHRRIASPPQPDRALLRRSRPGGEMLMFFFLAPVDAPNKKNREDGRRDCEPFAPNVNPRSSNEFRGGVTA